MGSNLKEWLSWAICATLIPFAMREWFNRDKVTILVYHKPAPEAFLAHLRLLRRRYSLVSIHDYIGYRRGTLARPLPPKSMVLTFDDGDVSLRPLLEELRDKSVPVSIFLCSELVGTNRRFWFNAPGLSETTRQRLKCVPDEERLHALAKLGFLEDAEWAIGDSLTMEDVRTYESFVDFQSHGATHAILPMTSDEKSRTEIAGSKQSLDTLLRRPSTVFAYPNGSYGPRETTYVGEAGYACAVTTRSGVNGEHTPLLELNRINVRDDCGPAELLVRASGLWELVRAFMQPTRQASR